MPHSCGAPKRSRRVGVAIYLCIGICFLDFRLGKSGVGVGVEVGVGGYQWQSLLFCCSLRCVPGPIRVDIMKINTKNSWGKNTHTQTHKIKPCVALNAFQY